jgi:hypothetical protein
MALRLDRVRASSSGATQRVSSLVALAVLAVPPPSAGHELAPSPPSSVAPKVAKQQVVVSHEHRRARACTPVPGKNPTSCVAQLGPTGAATSVFLEPIAASNGAPSRNQRVVVTFLDVSGIQKQLVELPVGEWTVEWPGCRQIGRLVVSAAQGVAPRVMLRTTSGSCELSSSQCRLAAGTMEQRLLVEEG